MPPPSSSSPPDPLFGWRTAEEDILSFDRDNTTTSSNSYDNPADQLLGAVGGLLDHAEGALAELIADNNDNVLGTAIFRGCHELANAVGHLATELEQQSPEDRKALADACYQDVVFVAQQQQQQEQQLENLLLTQSQRQNSTNMTLVSHQHHHHTTDLSRQLSSDDILAALSGASTLLRDVEVGLRGLEQDEADEIADVALTLARLFLASLQSFHSSIVDQHQEQQEEKRQVTANRFELIIEDDEDDESETKRNEKQRNNQSSQRKRSSRNDRLRVLWPPLGPTVATVCDWGKEEAIKRPLLAVTLGMTLWPAAVVTALIGTPLVLADSLVQHTYETFQEGPIVSNVEKAAAQAFQAGKLSFVCGKLVGRQSLRVLHRQVDRQGGLGAITQNIGGMVVERALHPIETMGAAWDGLQWGWQLVQSNLRHLNVHNNDEQDAENASGDEWE